MNDDNNTTAPQNNKNGNIVDEAPTEMVQPPEAQLNEETNIIGWRPSRARANWRVRQLPVTPRLRHELRDLANLYDKLANKCFHAVLCIAINMEHTIPCVLY